MRRDDVFEDVEIDLSLFGDMPRDAVSADELVLEPLFEDGFTVLQCHCGAIYALPDDVTDERLFRVCPVCVSELG